MLIGTMELNVLAVAKYLHSQYSGTSVVNTDNRRKSSIVNRHTGKKTTHVKLFRNETWEEASHRTKMSFIAEAKRILKIAITKN